jgi:hypothetical protein
MTRQSAEDRLAQQARQRMPRVLPGSPIVEHILRHHGQSQRIIQFPIRQQASIARHPGTMKLELQAPVKTNP